jgi:hypothetical protein
MNALEWSCARATVFWPEHIKKFDYVDRQSQRRTYRSRRLAD